MDTRHVSQVASLAAAVSLEQKEGSGYQPRSGPSIRHNKAAMTTYLDAFVRDFQSLTQDVDPIYNPLTYYGDKKDSNESLIKKTLTVLNLRTAQTYILEGNPKIELDLQQNNYKIIIDAFLEEHYPRTISNVTINRSPEFIVRTLRLLLLNIEYYLKEDPLSKKKHLEAVKKVCLYIMRQGTEWAKDTTLWTNLFSNQQHYFAFCDLLENLKNRLGSDLKKLAKTLEVDKLPASLQNLKNVEEDLSKSFPRTLLQRLLDRPIPEDLLIDSKMSKLFENESLTFTEFKNSPISLRLKAVIIDENVFNLIKYIFFGTTRKKLRKELTMVATKEALALVHAEKRSGTITLSASHNLLREGPRIEEGDEELDELKEPSPSPFVGGSRSTQLTISTLSKSTKVISDQYHHNLKSYVENRELIVAALPAPLRDAYNKQSAHSPTAVKHVKAYVESFVKGFYLMEQLIHLSENLSKSLAFHPHGGNLLTKQFMPLPNIRDSAYGTFTHIKTVTEELEELSMLLRNDFPKLNDNFHFRLNGNQALVLSEFMNQRIDLDGLNSLKAMHDSLSIESMRNDALDAMESLIGITVQQIELQGMNVHFNPLFRLFPRLISSTLAMADHYQLELRQAERRYSQFVDQLPALEQPLYLPASSSNPEHAALEEISLDDLLDSQLKRPRHFTLRKVLKGTLIQEMGQHYLTIDGEQILLTTEAKNWLLANQLEATRFASNSNRDSTRSSLQARLESLTAQQQHQEELITVQTREMNALQKSASLIEESLPRYNRHQDLSTQLCQWWVPLTIFGLPLFVAAQLYRLLNKKSIARDCDKYSQLLAQQQDINQQIENLGFSLSQQKTILSEIREQQKRLVSLQDLDEPPLESKHDLAENSLAASTNPISHARQTFFAKETKLDINEELNSCAVALLKELKTTEIPRLFELDATQLRDCFLAARLEKIQKSEAILRIKDYRESIFNIVIAKLLTPSRFEKETQILLAAVHKDFKGKLPEFTPQELVPALELIFDRSRFNIKNTRIKQYIIQVLVIPKLEMETQSTPSPALPKLF